MWGIMRHGGPAVAALAIGGGTLLGSHVVSAQPTDPAALTQRLLEAISRQALAEAANLVSDDVLYTAPGPCAAGCRGKVTAGAEVGRLVNDATRFANPTTSVNGGTVTGRAEMSSNGIRGAGVNRILVGYRVDTANSLVTTVTLTPDTTDAETARYVNATAAQPTPGAAPRVGAGIAQGDVTSGAMAVGTALVILGLGATGLAVERRRR